MLTSFLKCDADGCDHRETVGEISEGMIDMPCPKCGANLLTDADYQLWQKKVAPQVEILRSLGLIRSPEPEEVVDHSDAIATFGAHDGAVSLTIKEGGQ